VLDLLLRIGTLRVSFNLDFKIKLILNGMQQCTHLLKCNTAVCHVCASTQTHKLFLRLLLTKRKKRFCPKVKWAVCRTYSASPNNNYFPIFIHWFTPRSLAPRISERIGNRARKDCSGSDEDRLFSLFLHPVLCSSNPMVPIRSSKSVGSRQAVRLNAWSYQ
jgi:hypothetical protein